MSNRIQSVQCLLRAKQYVLVTPDQVILEGSVDHGFNGLQQINALQQVKTHITTIITDWEKANGGNKSRSGQGRSKD